ncbi:MAG: GNAT family N-acetyltransferase [Myxococcota bacterium]
MAVPPGALAAGRYVLRFAASDRDLREVQRLRFEVFNLELNEGLDSAFDSGRDEDELDASCHHLMVEDRISRTVVGTYRMMTGAMARSRGGFYAEGEFDLDELPEHVMEGGVEVGRACVHPAHRNGRVILLLWRGIARYLEHNRKRYLFGCCSLPTLDESVARRVLSELAARGCMHPTVRLRPLPALRCGDAPGAPTAPAATLPTLMQGYLRLGAQVASDPAVDRTFKVIDFFVLLDLASVDARVRRTFFAAHGWELAAPV